MDREGVEPDMAAAAPLDPRGQDRRFGGESRGVGNRGTIVEVGRRAFFEIRVITNARGRWVPICAMARPYPSSHSTVHKAHG